MARVWVQLRYLSAAGPVDVLDDFDAVEASPRRRKLRRVAIGGASRSRYFICQRCGSKQLRAALMGHIQKPTIGLSECERIQYQARKALESERP